MPQLIFILGGARSGKSSYAVELAKRSQKDVVFIATARALDKEMRRRISMHRHSRPRGWRLVEEDKDVASALSKLDGEDKIVLIDCLGLLISNFLVIGTGDAGIKKIIEKLIRVIRKVRFTVILISNEVGAGIVPENALARRFRDLLGWANQMLANSAERVISMQAGIPVRIK